MIRYINQNKKKLVGRNNQINTSPLVLDYSCIEKLKFQFINDINQIQDISNISGLYFAGSLKMGEPSSGLIFLSQDYTVENNILIFDVDTYTVPYLDKIKKKNTEINIEIGQIDLDNKVVLLRDYALACPRVYVEGLSPSEISSNNYYNKTEVDELLSSKQNLISSTSKLDYSLISGTPTIPTVNNSTITIKQGTSTKGSFTLNQSGDSTITLEDSGITSSYVNEKIGEHNLNEDAHNSLFSNKQDKITNEKKLAYSLLSGTPTIPTVNNSTITLTQGGVTKGSFKLNQSTGATINFDAGGGGGGGDVTEEMLSTAISNHNEDSNSHSGLFDSKQDKITENEKLSYGLISGTPTIPLSTSQLVNDSFIPSSSPVVVGDITNDGNYLNSGNTILVNNVNLLGNTSGNLIINTGSITPNISGNNSIVITTDARNSTAPISSFSSYSINIGNNYMKTTYDSVVEGFKNEVKGTYNNVAIGNYNTIGGTYNNFVFGYGLKAGGSNNFVIGKYNDDTAFNTFFALGDGTSDTIRHNIILINALGGMKYDKANVTSQYYDSSSTSALVIGHDIIACAGFKQAVHTIPMATSSVLLTTGVYTHYPSTASVYTLPVPDSTCTTEVVVYINFSNTQSYTFKDRMGNTVTPLSTPTIETGCVVCFLCTFNLMLGKWAIMPIEMGV